MSKTLLAVAVVFKNISAKAGEACKMSMEITGALFSGMETAGGRSCSAISAARPECTKRCARW